ncbi:MAG: lysophospholipid acyltransferase family protein [Tunicatimonas sp.]
MTFFLSVLLKLLSHLPLSVLYVASDLLAWVAYRVVRYRRGVVLSNLARSFPEKPPTEIRQITRAFYTNLSDVVVETLKAFTISELELKKRVVFRELDLLNECYERKQSVILLAAHQGNWEWLLLAGCLQLPFPVDAVYKPLKNSAMDTMMHRMRARFGGQPIAKERVLREVLHRREQVRATTLVADQTPAAGTARYWVDFLHQKTGFYRAVEQLPKALNYPVFFVRMKRLRRGYYEATFVPVGTPPYDKETLTILPHYAQEAQRMIEEQPANWLWSHKRWKHCI